MSNSDSLIPAPLPQATAPPHSLISHLENGRLHLNVQDDSSGCPPPKQALIGVFSTSKPSDTEKRHILRQVYKTWNAQLKESKQIDIIYYLGNAADYESDFDIATEQAVFEDLVVMHELEDRDSGKILEWFRYSRSVMYSQHPSGREGMFCQRYRFVGKGDIDAVFHIVRLSRLLSGLSTQVSWFIGRSFGAPHFHMTGMLYLLSLDIVEWINFSPIPKQHMKGVEDVQVGKWLLEGNIKFQKSQQYSRFHDLEESPMVCIVFVSKKQ
ncbi:UNVERIFIED_CONTAM: hypothetical protein HDU68_007398 [Siphonaria sp. JEL0065]|nr:hypothetical protein HDU68_007398 [Siphonaria sp. JEL0065]